MNARQLPMEMPPPPAPEPFVNREIELERLRGWLLKEKKSVFVLTGSAGIGKSALAAKFVSEQVSDGWNAIWLEARGSFDREDASKEVAEAAANARLMSKAIPDQTSGRTLVILDDEGSIERIRLFVSVPELRKVLITTRDPRLAAIGVSLSLRGLSYAETRQLIHLLEPGLERRDTASLADRLQGNPLTVRMAVSALQSRSTSLDVAELVALLDLHAAQTPRAAGVEIAGRRAAHLARDDYASGTELVRGGQYEAAVESLTRAVSGLAASRGASDPDTLAARASLGDSLRLSGRTYESIAVLQELVETCMTELGPDDPRTLSAQMGLASAQRDAGEPAVALTTLTDVLPRMEKIHGSEHPDTLYAMSNLAVVLFDLGRVEEALRTQVTIVDRLQAFGHEQPMYLTAQSNMAQMLASVGDPSSAVQLQEDVVQQSEMTLGPEHPDTLTALSNLASTLSSVEQLDRARTLEEEVLRRRQHVLGRNHPDTLATINNLAVTLIRMGADEEAVKLSEQVVDGYRERAARNQSAVPELVNSLAVLSQALLRSGQAKRATKVIYEAVDVYRRLPDSFKASIRTELSSFVDSLEDRPESLPYSELTTLREELREDSSE